MSTAIDAPTAPRTEPVLHHPPGLYYLTFTEVWERFSFYGMQALLVLYMVDYVLTPGHIEGIVGMGGFRAVLENIFGALSTQALASQIFGLYTGFVYLTPLFGGWLGDQVLGQRRTVLIGAILMAAGHLMMAFEASFLLALLMLILGSGCLKGNISAQVGALYPRTDHRRTPAFALFNLGINVGAFVAPLVCGTLGELYGWHYGFGLAAIGMLAGIAVYVAGGKHLPPDTLKPRGSEPRPRLQRRDMPVLFALAAMLILGTFIAIPYAQEFNVFNIWARDTIDQSFLGYHVPITWYPAYDGLFIVLFTPFAMRYWTHQVGKGRASTDLTKIGWSGVMATIGMLSLAAASWIAEGGEKASMLWPIFCLAIFALAFIYSWPVTLALCSRLAPPAIGGLIMGIAFLSVFLSNYAAGFLGVYYELMTPANFWLMHAAIAAAGSALILLFYIPLNRELTPLRGLIKQTVIPALAEHAPFARCEA